MKLIRILNLRAWLCRKLGCHKPRVLIGWEIGLAQNKNPAIKRGK